ncbi:hypothetical protein VC83_02979 [Pseudogymnoascus destructans]|uniref:Stress-associated endoplasmic reticulum protein n=2 Tax=Pseudogymnoascus destructans TaxID=655981 RepID=L8FSR6_PSED2|nr:uncharacterized protein VC83_02979 [Pseudogymnoascus destructans]ELR04015.1 hypothetical protein GMDG_06530 [Pseudogymnoascus destructans 20631-21]OAF60024.1 hypothetical protein VC83_02979 [Pseudogymnoascus destructans]
MAQTPQQRKSNQKFAKENRAKMGKPEGTLKKKQQTFKSPVSPTWLGSSNHYIPIALHLLIRPLSSPFSIRGVRWSDIRVNFEGILQINEADQGGGEIDTRGKRNVAISNKMRDPNFKLHSVPNIISQAQFNIRIED